MIAKKIYCEVLESVTYSDRCLFKLSKVIEGNPTCEECILRQLERVKSGKTNVLNVSFISSNIKTSSDISDGRTRKRRGKRGQKRRSKLIESETKQMYSIQELSDLLGKAARTIQGYAKEGRIPAQKAGRSWYFRKEEIDRLLSKREKGDLGVPKPEDREKEPEFQKGDFLPVNQGEPEKEV